MSAPKIEMLFLPIEEVRWHIHRSLLATFLCITAAAACGGDAPAPEQGRATVRDSAGIRVIETPSPITSSGWRSGDAPLVEIGVLEGDPGYQFERIEAATRLPDGRIVVAENRAGELRYYGADGAHLLSVGARGDGPDEYRTGPGSLLLLPGDSVSVQDRLDRLIYDPAGRFVRRITGRPQTLQEFVGTANGTWQPDGSLIALVSVPIPAPLVPTGLARQAQHVIRISPDYASADTLFMVPGGSYQITAETGLDSPVFYVTTRASLSPGGAGWVLAEGGSAEVRRVLPDGAQEIVRWEQLPAPVTADDVEHWIRSFVDRAPERELSTRARFAALDVPAYKPIVGWIVNGSGGRVLIASGHPRDPAFPEVQWSIIDPDGTFRGPLELPSRFFPLDLGPDWILGEWRDELDVPYLHLYRLERTGS